MGEDEEHSTESSLLQNIKEEISSIWDSFQGEGDFKTKDLPALNIETILKITKTLSGERQKINQRLEHIKKEIDLLVAKGETLKLVGGDDDESQARISELSDLGSSLTEELEKIDQKLRLVRQQREVVEQEYRP